MSVKMVCKVSICVILSIICCYDQIIAKQFRFNFTSFSFISLKYKFNDAELLQEYYDLSPKYSICKVLDSELVYNFTCKTKLLNHTMSKSSMELILQPGVVLTNMHMKLQLFRKFGTVVRPFLVKFEQDFCDFVNKDNSSILYHLLLLDEMRVGGNFFDPCPLSGRRYSTGHFEYSKLPEILPDGEFRLDIKSYTLIENTKRYFVIGQFYTVLETKTAL